MRDVFRVFRRNINTQLRLIFSSATYRCEGKGNVNMYTPTALESCAATRPNRFVDLRSDTFTLPTPEMRKAMFEAEVGDDVFGEDPTINDLQERAAKFLKKEAAIFVPSGTMSNLIAILAHCNTRGDKVLIGDQSHILLYEDDGASMLGGVAVHTIPNHSDGTFDLDLMEEKLQSLVCIENTFNGCALPLDFIDEVGLRLSRRNVPLHVDGARLFNAAVYHNVPASRLVEGCASVSVCLSKGLGAPSGSVLAGTADFIHRAHRLRHLLGGAMRQVGVLGAPGLVALKTGVDRLAEDHRRMFEIASAISAMKSSNISLDIKLVHTNMAFIHISSKCGTAKDLVQRLGMVTEHEKAALGRSVGIKCFDLGPNTIRFVTYNAINDEDVLHVCEKMTYVIHEMDLKLNEKTHYCRA